MLHCRDSKNKGECADASTDANNPRQENIRKNDNDYEKMKRMMAKIRRQRVTPCGWMIWIKCFYHINICIIWDLRAEIVNGQNNQPGMCV